MTSVPPVLSAVIPAHNEEGQIRQTVEGLVRVLDEAGISFELIVVDDVSSDRTPRILAEMSGADPRIRPVRRQERPGFGRAVREGLRHAGGEVVAIVMGDESDDPNDLVRYVRAMGEGVDAVFGSRWREGARVVDYPWIKRIVNRTANQFVRWLFWVPYNDLTNAFKAYRREVIEAVQPLESEHFNITLEIPLRALNRGFRAVEIPIHWYGRKSGVSRFSIRRLGKRYLYVTLKCWLERLLMKEELRESWNRRQARIGA
jgi:dolichol-phosphate mannosyltransferase